MSKFLGSILAYGFILLHSLSGTMLQAQSLQLIPQPPPGATLSPTDCWNVTISNPGQREQVYLMGIIKDGQGHRLSEVRSAPLFLQPGINQLERQTIITARTDFKDPEAQRAVLETGYFPNGTYQICVAVIRNSDDRSLGLECLDYTVAADRLNVKQAKKQKKVAFYGNATAEAVYSNRQGFNQDLPPSYGRLDLNPALSIFQAPVTAQVHLTTEQTDAFPDLNTFAVRFDRATFQRNLQGMLLKKLQESFQKQTQTDAETMAKLKDLDRLSTIVNDPGLRRELLSLDSMQSKLSAVEADKSLSLEEKRAKLEKMRQRYDALLAKKRQVDRLMEQKNRLQYLKTELEQNGRLEEIKNRQFTAPNLSDPAVLRHQMKQYGLLEGANRFLFGIDELAIGTSYPVYSPLTMNGVQVNGGHLAWNPGLIYLAFTKGKTQSAYLNTVQLPESNYGQSVTGGSIGVGKKYRNHLSFTGLRYKDEAQSISLPVATERFPEQATVAASDFQLSLGRNRQFELMGEISGLLFNRNQNDTSRLRVKDFSNELPSWLAPNMSTSADFAWNGRMHLNLFNQKTRIIAATRFVGPGFKHPGSPGLRNDILVYEGRLEQSLWRNQVRLAGAYELENDNFSGGKGYQTLRNQISAEMSVHLRHLPGIRLRYTHSLQENNVLKYGADILSAGLTQVWKLGPKNRAHTNLQYLRFSNAVDSLTAAQFTANYCYLNQLFTFRNGLSLNAGAQLTSTTTALDNAVQQIYQAMISTRILKKANLGAGVTWANSREIDQKLGGQLQFQLSFNRHLNFDLQANFNQYTNLPGVSNQALIEQFIRARLSVSW